MKVYVTISLIAALHGSGAMFSDSFFHDGGSSSFHSSGSSSYSSHSHNNTDPCPVFTDHSADLLLSSNNTGYPEVAIGMELASRPLLLACLSRNVIPPSAASVPVDPTLVHAVDSCPSGKYPLNKFFRYNATCWMMREIQEKINFTLCGTTRCVTCDSGFSFTGQEHRCVPQYKYVSVWAFCEGRVQGDQIARERIIVPVACSCKKIQCNTNPWWFK